MASKVRNKKLSRKEKQGDNLDSHKVTILPKTESQRIYMNCILNHTLTFCTGSAGSGKTFIAASLAARLLNENKYDKLILTKPAVTAGENFGHLPGELSEKYKPYLEPFEDTLIKQLGRGYYEYLLKVGRILPKPLAYLRGVTFDNSIVILDEAQNTTKTQMKLFLTRIGNNCKIIVSGDTAQKDIKDGSGLEDAVRRLSAIPDVARCHFELDDCVRSELVKQILINYE